MKPFQVGVLIVFAVLAMVAVFIFATFSGGSRNTIGTVTIWGSLPAETIQAVFAELKRTNSGYDQVSYQEIPETDFAGTLVEAIAAGRGPDLVLLPAASIMNGKDKLIPLSYRSVSRRSFQDTFIQAGEVFLTDNGVLGLPFYIDPYVLFWNRSLFSQANIARPPNFWDEFVDIAPRLSRASEDGTLTQSAVALGEWHNVTHAKDIFVSLIVGLGNPVISVDDTGVAKATLNNVGANQISSAESALRFYTQFSDPVQSVYSWNRSQPDAFSAFLSGRLGVYLAPASEVFVVRASNPNLNFDIAPYPEVRGGTKATPAALYAFSVPRGSQNQTGAAKVALALADAPAQKALIEATGLPSVRRDTQIVSPENAYESIFKNAALNAYAFRDPNQKETDAIFRRMVEGVSSGKFRITESVRSGQNELEALLK